MASFASADHHVWRTQAAWTKNKKIDVNLTKLLTISYLVLSWQFDYFQCYLVRFIKAAM